MRLIKFKGETRTFRIPVEDDNSISIQSLNVFFPNVESLSYGDVEDEVGLYPINEAFKLPEDVTEFRVQCRIPDKANNSTKGSVEQHKKKRIDEILQIVREEENNLPDCESTDKQIIATKKNTRNLEIGWKNRSSLTGKFEHMRGYLGGIKVLELEVNKNYSYQDIIDLAVEAMKTKRNQSLFNDVSVQLGTYDNTIFENFTDDSGNLCDFWKFSSKIRQKNRHNMKLYIFTTEVDGNKENISNPSEVSIKLTSNQSRPTHSKNYTTVKTNPSSNFTPSRTSDVVIDKADFESLFSKTKASANLTPVAISKNTSNKTGLSGDSLLTELKSPNLEPLNTPMKNTRNNAPPSYSVSSESSSSNLNSNKGVMSLKRKFDENAAKSINYRLDTKDKIQINIPEPVLLSNVPKQSVLDTMRLSIPVIKTEEVILNSKQLGRGAFGTVNTGHWLGTEVAVKRVKMFSNNKYILREIQIMDKIRHPNVISIMAVGFNPVDCYIIMEYFKSSDLRKLLRSGERNVTYKLTLEQKNLILMQVCKAVAFLHELSPPILHKDIKPENILVNEYGVAKLCDMGLSKSDDLPPELHTTVGHNRQGTWLYMAPEILRFNEPASVKSDVWSLACVIHEVYSEKGTWINELQSLEGTYSDVVDKFKKIFELKKTPDLSEVPAEIRFILKSCFDQRKEARPKASTLLDILQYMTT